MGKIFTYDHQERKTKNSETINNGQRVLLSPLTYNELDNVFGKKWHSVRLKNKPRMDEKKSMRYRWQDLIPKSKKTALSKKDGILLSVISAALRQ